MNTKCSNFKKYSLICITFIFVILSFFVSFYRVDNFVSADTVDNNYSFSGSNIYVPCDFLVIQDTDVLLRVNDYLSLSFNFNYSLLSIDIVYITDNGYLAEFTENINISSSDEYVVSNIRYDFNGNISDYRLSIPFAYKLDSTFNFDVVSFNLYSSQPASALVNGYNFVDYIDTNGVRLSFRFEENLSFFENRIYYLSNSFTDNEYYNNGYNSGVSDGYNSGYDTGYNNGLTTGYNNGLNEGYNNGYNEGVNDSNNYTFFSLIGAVIDAPLTAFYGLFNFNLLGTNLSAFILSLLTLSVVIVVLRMALGGK